jgi:hypothetical protein
VSEPCGTSLVSQNDCYGVTFLHGVDEYCPGGHVLEHNPPHLEGAPVVVLAESRVPLGLPGNLWREGQSPTCFHGSCPSPPRPSWPCTWNCTYLWSPWLGPSLWWWRRYLEVSDILVSSDMEPILGVRESSDLHYAVPDPILEQAVILLTVLKSCPAPGISELRVQRRRSKRDFKHS